MAPIYAGATELPMNGKVQLRSGRGGDAKGGWGLKRMIAETAPAIAPEQVVNEDLRCVGEDRAMTRKPFDGCQWRIRESQARRKRAPGCPQAQPAFLVTIVSSPFSLICAKRTWVDDSPLASRADLMVGVESTELRSF